VTPGELVLKRAWQFDSSVQLRSLFALENEFAHSEIDDQKAGEGYLPCAGDGERVVHAKWFEAQEKTKARQGELTMRGVVIHGARGHSADLGPPIQNGLLERMKGVLTFSFSPLSPLLSFLPLWPLSFLPSPLPFPAPPYLTVLPRPFTPLNLGPYLPSLLHPLSPRPPPTLPLFSLLPPLFTTLPLFHPPFSAFFLTGLTRLTCLPFFFLYSSPSRFTWAKGGDRTDSLR